MEEDDDDDDDDKYHKTTYLTDKLKDAKMFRAYSTYWETVNRVYDQV